MRIKANNIEVEYSIAGSGKWLVLISGLAKDARMWEAILPALSQHYRVLTYDLRGWGGTEKPPGPYSFQLFSDDLYALVRALDVREAFFMGWSLGGYVIQQFISQHPEMVEAIILASTTSWRPLEAGQVMLQRADLVEWEGMGAVADGIIDRWWSESFRKNHPETVDKARELLLACDPKAFAATSRAIAQIDFVEQIKRITCPTLVLAGSLDEGIPVAAAQAIRDAIAGSQMHVIEGAAHDTITEQPQRIASIVLGFLTSIEGKP